MRVRRVVAPNPGPYTGPGTNTWVAGDGPARIVIDPGPDDDSHLAAIERALEGATVGAVLATHSHPDHLPLAARLAGRHQASVQRHPQLGDGDIVRVGGISLRALHTPGHCSDHLAFVDDDGRAVFTGDLVLGRGSSMVTYPEGDVAAYLHSLDRLLALDPVTLFPGHWDVVTDARAKLTEYRSHRLQRETKVVDALASGPASLALLVHRVYEGEIPPEADALWHAAEMTLRAHLQKLESEGRVAQTGSEFALT